MAHGPVDKVCTAVNVVDAAVSKSCGVIAGIHTNAKKMRSVDPQWKA